MTKYILTVLLLMFSLTSFAQEEKNQITIDTENLSEELFNNILSTASREGWVLIKSEEKNYMVVNLSNDDYTLYFYNCKNPSNRFELLVEYSNNYGDGDYGGIDFLSSSNNSRAEVNYILDKENFKNPFKNFKKKVFENFFEKLKTSNTLTIDIYDRDFEDQLELNRSISFKLKNGEFLDSIVDCN